MNDIIKYKNLELIEVDPLRYLSETKCNTALEALKIETASIAHIKRETGIQTVEIAVATILDRLFKVRYSKTTLTPEQVEEFVAWLFVDYYYLKLQEIELALISYEGEKIYHVIDLEVLKKMIEHYDMERIKAVELTREYKEPKKGKEMPDNVKQLMHKLMIGPDLKQKEERPRTLIELFEKQGMKNPKEFAERMEKEFESEYVPERHGDKSKYMKARVYYFISRNCR